MPEKIKEPEEILFGKPLGSLETYKLWLQHAHRNPGSGLTITKNADNFVDGTHPLAVMLRQLYLVWGKLKSNTGVTSGTTVMTPSIVLMNLGRLGRLTLEGGSRLHMMDLMDTELRRNESGVANTGTEMDALISAVLELWFLVGKGLDMFGTWDTTKNLAQDEAFAGWIACAKWITIWTNIHDANYMDHEKQMATYDISGGVVTGHFNELNITDPATFGSIMSAKANLGVNDQASPVATDFLGMMAAYVDEPITKGIKVWLHQSSEALIKRILSESSWNWRYERDIYVKPGFQLLMAETAYGRGEEGEALIESSMKNRPMKDYTNGCLLTFHRTLDYILSDFTSYHFKNKAFAPSKKEFSKVSIYDLPTPGEGTGGLLAFQMCMLKEDGAGADEIYNKLKLDISSDLGQLTLQERKVTYEHGTFQVIGDVPLADYLLMVGLNIEQIYIDGAVSTNFAKVTKYFDPYGGLIADFSRSEDEELRILRKLYSLIDAGTDKGDLDGKSQSPSEWVLGDTHAYGSTDFDYPVSAIHKKTIFYEGRASDPYKKLKHVVYDINEQDFAHVADVMCEAFGYIASKSEEIPVSAITSDKPWEKKEDETPTSAVVDKKKTVDDEETSEIEVSAVADETKKVDKLKKDLKVANDKLTKSKKKDSDDKKKAEKKNVKK